MAREYGVPAGPAGANFGLVVIDEKKQWVLRSAEKTTVILKHFSFRFRHCYKTTPPVMMLEWD